MGRRSREQTNGLLALFVTLAAQPGPTPSTMWIRRIHRRLDEPTARATPAAAHGDVGEIASGTLGETQPRRAAEATVDLLVGPPHPRELIDMAILAAGDEAHRDAFVGLAIVAVVPVAVFPALPVIGHR